MLGDEEGGRIEIDAARAGFDRLGAAADARHAATLLQHGHAARRVLTDREVQVLRLVAAGKQNRDIAGALHLSEHTVARHIQNILSKLACPPGPRPPPRPSSKASSDQMVRTHHRRAARELG
jgi:DNA-binding NarL/FixJ family response regulator